MVDMERVRSVKLSIRGASDYALVDGAARLLCCGPDMSVKAMDMAREEWSEVEDTSRAYSGLYVLADGLYLLDTADGRVVVERFALHSLQSEGVVLDVEAKVRTSAQSANFVALLCDEELLMMHKSDCRIERVQTKGDSTLLASAYDTDVFYVASKSGQLAQVTAGQGSAKDVDISGVLGDNCAVGHLCANKTGAVLALSDGRLCRVEKDDGRASTVCGVKLAGDVQFIAYVNEREVAVQLSDHISVVDVEASAITLNFDYSGKCLSVAEREGLLYVHDEAGDLNVYTSVRIQTEAPAEEGEKRREEPKVERKGESVALASSKKKSGTNNRSNKKSKSSKKMDVEEAHYSGDGEDSELEEHRLRTPKDEPLDVIVKKTEPAEKEEAEKAVETVEREGEGRAKPKRQLIVEEDEDEEAADAQQKAHSQEIDFADIEKFVDEMSAEPVPVIRQSNAHAEAQNEEPHLMLFEKKLAERDAQQGRQRARALRFISDESIGARMQPTVVPGAYGTAKDSVRTLCLNAMGSVSLHKYEDSETLVVEYKDNSLHKKQVLANKQRFELADMSLSGYVLATRGSAVSDDEYEDDSSAAAVLYYKSIRFDSEWSVEMGRGESLQLVALSTQYVFAVDSHNAVRVYTLGGDEIYNFAMDAPVVCICAFEHMLGVVTLSGLPLLGCQQLTLRSYDVNSMRAIFETKVSITPRSRLTWAGFSDDGVLYTQDSAGRVRVLFNRCMWTTVHESDVERRFWLTAVVDGELLGYKLGVGETAPSAHGKYAILRYSPTVYLSSAGEGQEQLQRETSLNSVMLHVEREKSVNLRHVKNSISDNPYLRCMTQRVLSLAEVETLEDANDVKKVELVRALTVQGRRYAAIYAATQIRSEANFGVAMALLERMKQKKMAEELKTVANESGLYSYLNSERGAQEVVVQHAPKSDGRIDEWNTREEDDTEGRDYFRVQKEKGAGKTENNYADKRQVHAATNKAKESKKRGVGGNDLLKDLRSKTSGQNGVSKQVKKVNKG